MNIKNNYNKCITNLACSISKYFELDYTNATLKELDNILESSEFQNVIVVLCDGMGDNLLDRTLPEDSFLRKNKLMVINSVCPSTTTSATTSMISGLNPVEHGWLGWDLYVKPIDKTISLFLNTVKDTDVVAADYNVARKYFPYKSITERINDDGKFHSKILFPFGPDSYSDLDDMFLKVKSEMDKKPKNYIYVYYEEPDHSLHDFGVGNEKSSNKILEINNKFEKFSKSLKNTLLIITADHGHINVEPITLSEIPELFSLLDGDISIESRFCSFRIKDGNKEKFVELFNRYLGDSFILKTKDEVISESLFGLGSENPLFRDSIGDFIAIALGNKFIRYNENSVNFMSMHAGFTEDEMKIPVIVYKK